MAWRAMALRPIFRNPSAWRLRGIRHSCSRSRRSLRSKAAPSTTRRFATTTAAASRDLPSGRRTSISFAIRAGAAAWRPLARIRFLTASMGVEFVKGLQGDDPKYLELVSTPKHFAVHSGPEPLRHGFNVDVSDHDLEDTYLPAFRATIVDGHADSIMCAYNAIDGAPACANSMLMQQASAPGLGIQRVRGFRLRCGCRHRARASFCNES